MFEFVMDRNMNGICQRSWKGWKKEEKEKYIRVLFFMLSSAADWDIQSFFLSPLFQQNTFYLSLSLEYTGPAVRSVVVPACPFTPPPPFSTGQTEA
jgi:phytoene dehydrogenase-like protein